MGLAVYMLGFYRGGFEIAVIVSLAMLTIVIISNFIGVALPFILTRLQLDPAMASSPLITSIVDVFGLLVYFWIATLILGMP